MSAPMTPSERVAIPFKVGDKVRLSPLLAGEITKIARVAGTWNGEFVATVRWDFPDRQSYESGELEFRQLKPDTAKANPRNGGRLDIGDWVLCPAGDWEGYVCSTMNGPNAVQLVNVSFQYDEQQRVPVGTLTGLVEATNFVHAPRRSAA